MKKLILLGTMLSITVLAAPAADAQFKSGVWKYKTSGHWVKGRCPAPRPGKGKVKLTRKGSKLQVQVLSGMVCRPKSMCSFKGRRKGKLWVVSNSATVDKEGGKASNWLKFVVRTKKKLTGSANSEYKHPSGFTCKWGFKFVVWQ